MNLEKQNESQPSLSDHGITKTIARKTFTFLRSISTAGGSGAGAAGVAIAVILIVLLITIITTINGGGAYVNAGTPPTTEPPPVVPTTCQGAGGQCKTTCATDETENTTVTDCSPDRCCVPQSPPSEEIICASISGAYCTTGSSDNCRPGTQENSTITSCSPNKCCVPSSIDNPGNDIKAWAEKIAAAIRPYRNKCYEYGPPGFTLWNVLTTRFTNNGHTTPYSTGSECGKSGATFFCTNLVMSSYKLAGYNGNYDNSVFDMVRKWESNPGYKVLRGDNVQSISLLKPGDVIFMGDTPNGLVDSSAHRHIVVVQSVAPLNSNGDGTIYILQANGTRTSTQYAVRGGRIKYNYLNGGTDQFWFGLGPRN